MVLGSDLGLQTVFDHHGLVRFDDNCGARNLMAGTELFARVHGRLMPASVGKEARSPRRYRQGHGCARVLNFAEFRTTTDRFDRDGFQNHLALGIAKSKTLAVMGVKPQLHAVGFLEIAKNVPIQS